MRPSTPVDSRMITLPETEVAWLNDRSLEILVEIRRFREMLKKHRDKLIALGFKPDDPLITDLDAALEGWASGVVSRNGK